MGALLGGAVDGFAQAFRIPHVQIVKSDVVVAQQHQLRKALQLGAQPGLHGFQPAHLVGKLVGAGGLTVGKIGVHHAQRLAVGGGIAAAEHARHVAVHAGNVAHHILRFFARDQRHAVVGLLAEELAVVAGIGDRLQRKLVIGQLGFLQRQNLHFRVGGKPVQHLRQAHIEGVHVPGGDLHGDAIPLKNKGLQQKAGQRALSVSGWLPCVRGGMRASRIEQASQRQGP